MIDSLLLVCPHERDTANYLKVLVSQYSVTNFQSGEELLQYLIHYPVQDPVAVIDSAIDDYTLVQIAEKVKKTCPMMYLVGLIKDNDPALIVAAVKAGISEVVMSPYEAYDIKEAVQKSFEHLNRIDHLQRQISNLTEDILQQRIETFRRFVESRKKQNVSIEPSEIQLFFPNSIDIPINEFSAILQTESLKELLSLLNYQPRLLVIEDEPLLNRLLNQILSREFEVVTTFSAEECIAAVESHPPFDIALMDIGLPGVTGDELLKDVKEICPSIRILMLTGYTDHARIVKVLTAGAKDFITKPFDHQSLIAKISAHLYEKIIIHWIKKYLDPQATLNPKKTLP